MFFIHFVFLGPLFLKWFLFARAYMRSGLNHFSYCFYSLRLADSLLKIEEIRDSQLVIAGLVRLAMANWLAGQLASKPEAGPLDGRGHWPAGQLAQRTGCRAWMYAWPRRKSLNDRLGPKTLTFIMFSQVFG